MEWLASVRELARAEQRTSWYAAPGEGIITLVLRLVTTQAGGKQFWELWDMFNLSDGLSGIYWPALLVSSERNHSV
jgi:hypothetical protein